jgi:hypothetical protein
MTFDEYLNRVRRENPTGRGRPHSIAKLVQKMDKRARPPRRITPRMRVQLDDRLKELGFANDRVLDPREKYTRLWVEESATRSAIRVIEPVRA